MFGGGKKNQFLEEQERVNKLAKSQASLILLSEKYEGRDVKYSYGSELVWSEGNNCAYLLQITYDQGRKAGNHFYLVPFRDGEYMGMQTITYAMTEEEFAEIAKTRIEYVTALEEVSGTR